MTILPQPDFIGDGVYVKHDGYHLVLTTGDHRDQQADNRVYLEPSVLFSLLQYIDRYDRNIIDNVIQTRPAPRTEIKPEDLPPRPDPNE